MNILQALQSLGRGIKRVPGIVGDVMLPPNDPLSSQYPGVIVDEWGRPYEPDPTRSLPTTARSRKPGIGRILGDAAAGFMQGAAVPNIAAGGGTDLMRAGTAAFGGAMDRQDRRIALQRQAENDQMNRATRDAQIAENEAQAEWCRRRNTEPAQPIVRPYKDGAGNMRDPRTNEIVVPAEAKPTGPMMQVGMGPTGQIDDYGAPLTDSMTGQQYPPWGSQVSLPVDDVAKLRNAQTMQTNANKPRTQPGRWVQNAQGEFIFLEAPSAASGEIKATPSGVSKPPAAGRTSTGGGKSPFKQPTVSELTDRVIRENAGQGAKSYAEVIASVNKFYQDDPHVSRNRDAIVRSLLAREKQGLVFPAGNAPPASGGAVDDGPEPKAQPEPPPSSFVATMKPGQIVDDKETGAAWQKQADGTLKRVK